MMYESLYSTKSDKGVQCGICPHKCNLSEGQRGLCKSRINRGGRLITEAYGHLCALHIDPVEKKPLLHFYPNSRCLSLAATGCNFACRNCQNWEISQAEPASIPSEYYPPEQIVKTCLETDCPAIAYTYTEPITFFEYMYDTAKLAHETGIRNILVSAGYINEAPLRQLCEVIDAANIDLKSFSDELYVKINCGHLAPVLDTLQTMKEAGVWLEITNLVIPTVNDSMDMIREMCHWLSKNGFKDTPLHFSRFFPMYQMQDIPPTPVKTLIEARDIAREEGLEFVYIGNVDNADMESTFCPSCHHLLVKRNGYHILRYHVTSEGKCEYCRTAIPGHWGEKLIR